VLLKLRNDEKGGEYLTEKEETVYSLALKFQDQAYERYLPLDTASRRKPLAALAQPESYSPPALLLSYLIHPPYLAYIHKA
jgi:hypothetical protein